MGNSKGIANATLVLRICALAFAVASFVLLLINKVTVTISDVGDADVTFKDFYTYRYMFSTAGIGAVYLLFQLPFSVYHASTGKRMIRGDFLPAFDFYGDKVISGLMVSGVGAGFAVTSELKRFLEEEIVGIEKFFDKGYIASGLLLGAFVCMLFLSMFSSLHRAASPRKGLYG